MEIKNKIKKGIVITAIYSSVIAASGMCAISCSTKQNNKETSITFDNESMIDEDLLLESDERICIVPEIIEKENGNVGLKMPIGYVPYFIGQDENNKCGFWGFDNDEKYEIYWLSEGYLPEGYVAVQEDVAYALKYADSIKNSYATDIKEPLFIELDTVGEQNNGLKVPTGYIAFCTGDEETYCFNKIEEINDEIIYWSSQNKPLKDYVGVNSTLYEKLVSLGQDTFEKTMKTLVFADKTVENIKKMYGISDSINKVKTYSKID